MNREHWPEELQGNAVNSPARVESERRPDRLVPVGGGILPEDFDGLSVPGIMLDMAGPFHPRCLTLLLVACLVAGCASSTMSRIDANRAVYEAWPLEMQEAVLSGRAVPGMTPEMVRMALGEPTKIDSRDGKTGEEEVWVYEKGGGATSSILNNSNISMGGNIGGIGVSGPSMPLGGSNASANTDEGDEVVFQNGVVLRSSKL